MKKWKGRNRRGVVSTLFTSSCISQQPPWPPISLLLLTGDSPRIPSSHEIKRQGDVDGCLPLVHQRAAVRRRRWSLCTLDSGPLILCWGRMLGYAAVIHLLQQLWKRTHACTHTHNLLDKRLPGG